MGIPILILGESGTGKSCSMRNFSGSEVLLINVMSKPLPFRTDIKPFNLNTPIEDSNSGVKLNAYQKIQFAFDRNKKNEGTEKYKKIIVIDDAQYLMVNEMMDKTREQGYQKWSDMAKHFYDLLFEIREVLPDDITVYLMAHTETDANGKERFKTVGKLLDSYSIEGVCTICLKTVVDNGYWFATQNNGFDTVKSPMGLFSSDKIENDLKMVDDTVREFYNIPLGQSNKTTKKDGKK